MKKDQKGKIPTKIFKTSLNEKEREKLIQEIVSNWKNWTGSLEELTEEILRKFKKPIIYPTLEPVEKNLIDIALWYPSTKGLPQQKPEIKTWTIKKKDLEIEYDYQLSLPTIFTFEIAGILLGIWQDQKYPETFLTSLGEICRRKGIPATHGNRDSVLIAIKQLHNTRISAPFWEINRKGKKVNQRTWKINIINIEAENIRPGADYTLELRFSKYIANNIKQKYFTLLDYNLLGKLKIPTAKRLYSIIQKYSDPYQIKLSELKKLLNLRGTHAKQVIERASKELVDINFLNKYEIEKGKRVRGFVYRAFKAKGSKKTLKGQ